MKKFFFLMLVAGMVTTSVNAQNAINGSAPRPLSSCSDSPLNPIAGKPYDYSATINPAAGTTYWYATKATTFMTAGKRVAGIEIPADGNMIVTGATNYMTNGNNASSPTKTNVTWTSNALAGVDATHPLFMVLEYSGPTCSNNMKVYQILPKNAFTVDILNIDNNGLAPKAYDATDDQCYSDIASAKYDPAISKMVYDYGVNYLYYEVVAANFTGSFTPTFKISGLQTGQSAKVEWTVDKTIASGLNSLGSQTATSGADLTYNGTAVNTALTNTTNGVSIYVKVTVNNGLYEGLTDGNIIFSVEAVNAANEHDVENTTCAAPATQFEDKATQILKARPTLTSDPATGTFVTQTMP